MENITVTEIVRLNTHYHNNERRFYLSLHNLLMLCQTIDKEVRNNAARLPNYIRIIPHYENMKIDVNYQRIELDEYMLYIECRDIVTEETKRHFLESCQCQKNFLGLENNEIATSYINLIQKSDIIRFLNTLKEYFNFIVDCLVPNFYAKMKKLTNADEKEIYIGEFSFEIHCN